MDSRFKYICGPCLINISVSDVFVFLYFVLNIVLYFRIVSMISCICARQPYLESLRTRTSFRDIMSTKGRVSSSILNSGRWTKYKDFIFPNVIHHP
jgi:hypothetical protein